VPDIFEIHGEEMFGQLGIVERNSEKNNEEGGRERVCGE